MSKDISDMNDDIEKYQTEIETTTELQRRHAIERITKESERLVEELLAIIYSEARIDPRVKLQAIGMLMDRSIPKLGVDHTKSEVIEESRTRKRMKEEIEELVKKELNK